MKGKKIYIQGTKTRMISGFSFQKKCQWDDSGATSIKQLKKKEKSQPRIPCLAKRSFQKEVRKRLFSDLTTRRLTLEEHFKGGLSGKKKTIPDGNLGLHKEIKITGNVTT